MSDHVLTALENEKLEMKRYNFLPTGLTYLDEMRGITTEDFLTIFGGSGSGKSTIALFMACNMAKKGKKVVFLNAENSPKVMVDRIKELGFDYMRDFGVCNDKGQNRLIVISKTSIKFQELAIHLNLYKPDAMFIDLFSSLLDDVETSMVSKMTTQYAKDLSFYPAKYNCAIIVTEQLIKDNKRIARPTLNDVAGGAGLIRKSTKCLGIYRYARERMETIMAKAVAGKAVSGQTILNTTELLPRKDRLGHWGDGMGFVKFELNDGFVSLDYEEQTEYLKDVFNIGGKK